jgi:hypothetical protein
MIENASEFDEPEFNGFVFDRFDFSRKHINDFPLIVRRKFAECDAQTVNALDGFTGFGSSALIFHYLAPPKRTVKMRSSIADSIKTVPMKFVEKNWKSLFVRCIVFIEFNSFFAKFWG